MRGRRAAGYCERSIEDFWRCARALKLEDEVYVDEQGRHCFRYMTHIGECIARERS